MGRCGGCGALLAEGATWCAQCFLPVGGVTAMTPARTMVTTAPVAAPIPVQRVPETSYVAVGAPAPADRRAVAERVGLTVGAIALGLLLLVVMTLLGDGGRTEASVMIRYALVGTALLYVVVSAGVVRYLGVTGQRLRWHDGSPLTGAVIGAATGLTLALVLLSLVRAATGHASGDPRIALLVSEGGVDHVVTAVLIAVVAAPLVEETLFRGVLAESLRTRGRGAAIALSAFAFSAWHLQPAALRYYFAVGALLGALYWKRGLVCSMSAHAAFNGLLTLAAITTVSAAGPSVAAGTLVLHTPHGWTQVREASDAVLLRGPAASSVTVTHQPTPVPLTAEQILARVDGFAARMPLGVWMRTDTARIERLPVGDAVRIELTADGHAGVLVVLPLDGELYELTLASSGSGRAERDFERILHDVDG